VAKAQGRRVRRRRATTGNQWDELRSSLGCMGGALAFMAGGIAVLHFCNTGDSALIAYVEVLVLIFGSWLILALTEAVTRLSDRADPVPDALWEEAVRHYDASALAALIIAIATINVWNRLNVTTRQVAGEWANSAEARTWVESGSGSR